MFGSAGYNRGCRHGTASQLKKKITDAMAIRNRVIRLVAVVHQAMVTGGLAVFAHIGASVQIVAGVRIEVAQLQRLARDFRERGRRVE